MILLQGSRAPEFVDKLIENPRVFRERWLVPRSMKAGEVCLVRELSQFDAPGGTVRNGDG